MLLPLTMQLFYKINFHLTNAAILHDLSGLNPPLKNRFRFPIFAFQGPDNFPDE